MKERIARGLEALNLSPPPGAAEKLAEYGRLLLEQNQVMNLTAITQPDQVVDLHFLDSAALLPAGEWDGKRLIDVGTGAGFPGVPLAILCPSLQVTLLDSLGKRIHWLEEVCTVLELSNVTSIHARAEEQALQSGWRDSFDLAVSRAVAPLNLLSELCLPYVKVGGHFLAMKSVECDEEMAQAARGIAHLGGRLLPSRDYAIPGAGVTHRIVAVEKISSTPRVTRAVGQRYRKRLYNHIFSAMLHKSSCFS